MIKIDVGIPLPAGSKGNKYPFKQMEVGDSFFVAGKTVQELPLSYHNRDGKRFTARTIKHQGGVSGVRIWRTK